MNFFFSFAVSLKTKKKRSFLPSTSFSMPVFTYSSPVARGHSSSSSFGKIKRPASIYQRCSLISSARARPGGVTSRLPPSGLHRPSGHSGGHPSQITRPVADRKPQLRPPPIIYSHYIRGPGHLMDELVSPARPLVAQPADAD